MTGCTEGGLPALTGQRPVCMRGLSRSLQTLEGVVVKNEIFRNFLLQRLKLTTMNKITTYFRESYRELLEKVTWPTWLQLQSSTVIVLVATLLITLLVWLMDLVSSSILHFVYSLF
jgi:preprotein translocase subunit SecE